MRFLFFYDITRAIWLIAITCTLSAQQGDEGSHVI